MQDFIVLICFVVVLGILSIVSILIGPDERLEGRHLGARILFLHDSTSKT